MKVSTSSLVGITRRAPLVVMRGSGCVCEGEEFFQVFIGEVFFMAVVKDVGSGCWRRRCRRRRWFRWCVPEGMVRLLLFGHGSMHGFRLFSKGDQDKGMWYFSSMRAAPLS